GGPKRQRNQRYQFAPGWTEPRLIRHSYFVADCKSKKESKRQRCHLHPEGFKVVILCCREAHELQDSGRQQHQKADEQPPLAFSSDWSHRLSAQSKSQET